MLIYLAVVFGIITENNPDIPHPPIKPTVLFIVSSETFHPGGHTDERIWVCFVVELLRGLMSVYIHGLGLVVLKFPVMDGGICLRGLWYIDRPICNLVI